MIAESSLGYYINPLVNFALGIIIFKDRPSFWQKIAIALAFIAILTTILIWLIRKPVEIEIEVKEPIVEEKQPERNLRYLQIRTYYGG